MASCWDTWRPIAVSKAWHGANNAVTEAGDGLGAVFAPGVDVCSEPDGRSMPGG
jgi:hypothetical protein